MINLKVINKKLSGFRGKLNNGFINERCLQAEDHYLEGYYAVLCFYDSLLNPHISLNYSHTINRRVDEFLKEK